MHFENQHVFNVNSPLSVETEQGCLLRKRKQPVVTEFTCKCITPNRVSAMGHSLHSDRVVDVLEGYVRVRGMYFIRVIEVVSPLVGVDFCTFNDVGVEKP